MATNYNDDPFVLIVAGTIGTILLGILSHSGTEAYKARQLKEMPDSYWEAKKAEAQSAIEIRREELAQEERLTLDKRQREQEAAAAKREFEKAAPPEYWTSLAEQAKAKEQAKIERDKAAAVAKAASEFRRAANGW